MSRIAMLSNYNCNASGYCNAKMKTIDTKKKKIIVSLSSIVHQGFSLSPSILFGI